MSSCFAGALVDRKWDSLYNLGKITKRDRRGEHSLDAKQDFSRGSMAGNILRMAIPMTIAQMVNVLYSVVDRFFIGHIDGASSMALTGVGIVFPIISVITAFTNLFGMGGAPLCSIARGRQDLDLAGRIQGSSCYMLALTAVDSVFASRL